MRVAIGETKGYSIVGNFAIILIVVCMSVLEGLVHIHSYDT